MIYSFRESIFTEGRGGFIRIPFNVWDETSLKGNIPCRVTIEAQAFECKLIPKGNGNYWIPVPKKIRTALAPEDTYEIVMEPIEALSRINHHSPYSRENPVRKIDGIEAIPIQAGLCGHCCVAMLAGVSLADVVALMGEGHASWSKILEALDYYGISYAPKAVYPRGGTNPLPPAASWAMTTASCFGIRVPSAAFPMWPRRKPSAILKSLPIDNSET